MKVAIDLKAMTVAEKLELMEAIWADLDKKDVPSPAWHGDVLREREERLKRGEEKLHDLDDVEAQIRKEFL